MMNKKFICALLSIAVICASCSKPPAPPEGGDTAAASDEGASPETKASGVVITKASLWELQSDNTLKWAKNANAGDVVEWTGRTGKYVDSYSKKENDYYNVFAGGDYWIRTYAAAGPAIPAVVISPDAVVYDQPNLKSTTTRKNKTVRENTIIAVTSTEDNFIQFSAYYVIDEAYYVFSDLWLKRENISTDPSDVEGISLYQIALETEDPVVRKELLTNALSVSGRFSDLIYAALGEGESEPDEAAEDYGEEHPGTAPGIDD
jgi:hypothetical protein